MKYDCIVCGAGPSGIAAAIKASRKGLRVLLIEATGLLGGANVLSLVGPLMTFHSGKKQVIKGIASEIVDRLVNDKLSLGHIEDPLGFASTITPVDTEGLKQLYFDLIKENNIDLLLHTLVSSVVMDNNKVTKLNVINKAGQRTIEADIFIDATGDGDIATLAKAQYFIGRKIDNLCQPMSMLFVVGNVDIDQLRESMKNNKDNFVLRDNYDYKYIGISGYFEEIKKAKDNKEFSINRDRILLFENVYPGDVTINTSRVIDYNPLDDIERTKAEIEGRMQIKEIFNFLKTRIKGFENSYIKTTPYQIGIRETRHIITDYIIDKEDIINSKTFDDAIAVGAFPIDIHSPSSSNLETFTLPKEINYQIPLRVLLPIGLDNMIITGRAVGATHEACASLRVTPIVMTLGEAAGALAYAYINEKASSIHQIKIDSLKKDW